MRARHERLIDELDHLVKVLVLGEQDEGFVMEQGDGPRLEPEPEVHGPAGQGGLAVPVEGHRGVVEVRPHLLSEGTEPRSLRLDPG